MTAKFVLEPLMRDFVPGFLKNQSTVYSVDQVIPFQILLNLVRQDFLFQDSCGLPFRKTCSSAFFLFLSVWPIFDYHFNKCAQKRC